MENKDNYMLENNFEPFESEDEMRAAQEELQENAINKLEKEFDGIVSEVQSKLKKEIDNFIKEYTNGQICSEEALDYLVDKYINRVKKELSIDE